jgi:hypothetical protein
MKHCLLLLAVVAALVVGAPAFAQFVFLDTNGDGQASCTSTGLGDDVLAPGTMNVDVYFQTNTNSDGSAVTCDQSDGGPTTMTINSYEILLAPSGTGSVTFNNWKDAMGYTTNLTAGHVGEGPGTSPGMAVAGNNAWIGLGSGTLNSPGKYKVGTVNVTVTGNEVLSILASDPTNFFAGETAFGTACSSFDSDNTYILGSDWLISASSPYGVCGTEALTPVVNTTWGKIKDLYNGK